MKTLLLVTAMLAMAITTADARTRHRYRHTVHKKTVTTTAELTPDAIRAYVKRHPEKYKL
jgi:hypothetical protein